MTFNEKIFTEVLIERTELALNQVRLMIESRSFPSDRFTDLVNVLTAHLICLSMIPKAERDGVDDV